MDERGDGSLNAGTVLLFILVLKYARANPNNEKTDSVVHYSRANKMNKRTVPMFTCSHKICSSTLILAGKICI